MYIWGITFQFSLLIFLENNRTYKILKVIIYLLKMFIIVCYLCFRYVINIWLTQYFAMISTELWSWNIAHISAEWLAVWLHEWEKNLHKSSARRSGKDTPCNGIGVLRKIPKDRDQMIGSWSKHAVYHWRAKGIRSQWFRARAAFSAYKIPNSHDQICAHLALCCTMRLLKQTAQPLGSQETLRANDDAGVNSWKHYRQ